MGFLKSLAIALGEIRLLSMWTGNGRCSSLCIASFSGNKSCFLALVAECGYSTDLRQRNLKQNTPPKTKNKRGGGQEMYFSIVE